MTLRVNPQDLVHLAQAHHQVAGEVQTASKPDPGLDSSMTSGYGPVGAEFAAAVGEFQTAFFESGSQLSRHYQSHGSNILSAGQEYVKSDEGGAQRVENV
jgi:Excreted virulence factor EspC, type VII ESX diderm